MTEQLQTEDSGSFDNQIAALINQDRGVEPVAPRAEQPRARDGKWTDAQVVEDAETEDEVPAKPVKAEKPEKAAAPEDDAEDYIELPPSEEGAEPERVKLSDVLQSHRDVAKLRTELETAKQHQFMPADVERELAQTIEARQQYIAGLQLMEQWMQPAQPDARLLDENSPNYNPQLYLSQMQQAQQFAEMRQRLASEAQEATERQQEQQNAVMEARRQREFDAAVKGWPELQDKAFRQTVVKDFSSAYGFTPEEVAALGDHRVLMVMKDALAYRSGQRAKEAAIKQVSAKPKLVRGSARQGGKAASFEASMERLSKTNSLDDGARAIAELF